MIKPLDLLVLLG